MHYPRYEAVVIGLSAGGLDVLKQIVPMLPASFPLPIIIAQHMGEDSDGFLANYLDGLCHLMVKEAEDKEPVSPGFVYMAPAGYHLLIEQDKTFSLSVDPRVNFSCPSIDVLFESAADTYNENLVGVIMTGANKDGSQGLKTIRDHGGLAIVQDPATAQTPAMPQAALDATQADYIVNTGALVPLLIHVAALIEGEGNESLANG